MSRAPRSGTRTTRKPKVQTPRPALVFRDFVRQLEKLDGKAGPRGSDR